MTQQNHSATVSGPVRVYDERAARDELPTVQYRRGTTYVAARVHLIRGHNIQLICIRVIRKYGEKKSSRSCVRYDKNNKQSVAHSKISNIIIINICVQRRIPNRTENAVFRICTRRRLRRDIEKSSGDRINFFFFFYLLYRRHRSNFVVSMHLFTGR